jgi:hypothetical protein
MACFEAEGRVARQVKAIRLRDEPRRHFPEPDKSAIESSIGFFNRRIGLNKRKEIPEVSEKSRHFLVVTSPEDRVFAVHPRSPATKFAPLIRHNVIVLVVTCSPVLFWRGIEIACAGPE